ncbi:MAG: flagellar M-ring protein FliF [Deltaproteobacteria bacterium]|nr:flagellar M-ring protein FliF [Deltaproteobacteria bacterium]
MPAPLKKLLEQLKKVYLGMSRAARVSAAVVILAAVLGLSYLVGADHTSYSTLFTGLAVEDAGRITEELKKSRVPFRIEGDGATVLVPHDKVHELRLSLAGQGLPRGGGVGFEIFDNQKFGVSDFAQQINYRRALQGELERTIGQLDAVKNARVHVAMPNQQLFARRARPVSASVTLRLHAGRTLSPSTVKAVVHLVSSSVAGLNAESVTVVDAAGTMLWGGSKGALAGTGGPLEYKQNLETSLEQRVSELLDATLGRGHSVVKVTAEVALAQVEQTDEQYDGDKSAVRSESSSEEKEATSGAQAGGVPGVKGNLAGGPAPTAGAPAPTTGETKAGMSRKQVTRNFEITKTVRRRVSPAGELQRVSVAVLVDSRTVQGKGQKKAEGVTTADLQGLEQVVKQAVGFSATRGDVVTLKAIPFTDVQPVEKEPETLPLVQLLRKNPLYAAVGGGALLLVVVVFFLLLRGRKPARAPAVLQLPATVKELEATAQALPGGAGQTLQLGAGDLPTFPGTGTSQGRQLALAAAEHEAARTAQVLRAWIAGG